MNKANITDAFGKDVFFGDMFDAYIMRPSMSEPTKVTVVKDVSKENLDCDRNFNVEDKNGDRVWNAYMVIKSNDYVWDGGKEAMENEVARIKAKAITRN